MLAERQDPGNLDSPKKLGMLAAIVLDVSDRPIEFWLVEVRNFFNLEKPQCGRGACSEENVEGLEDWRCRRH